MECRAEFHIRVISHNLSGGLLAAARSSKRRDAASGSRTRPFTPWRSTSSNENKERVPLSSGRHGKKPQTRFFSMLETAPFWAAQESYFDGGGGGKKTNPAKIGTIDLHWLWHLEIVVAAADENRERKLAAESRDDLLQGNKATRKLHIS